MGSVDNSLITFKQICDLSEERIDNYFARVDKNQIGALTLSNLSADVAGILGLKHQECFYAIMLHLRNRTDIEVRPGKNGGICRVGDEQVKSQMTPKECAMKHYNVIKECSFTVIADKFAAVEATNNKSFRLNFQDLCLEIANMLHLKKYAVYHCLKAYIEDERPDLIIEKGAYGGLMQRSEG